MSRTRHTGDTQKDCGHHDVEAFFNTFSRWQACGGIDTKTRHWVLWCFLYREVLGAPLERINAVRAKPPSRLPAVFFSRRGHCHHQTIFTMTPCKTMAKTAIWFLDCASWNVCDFEIKDVDFSTKNKLWSVTAKGRKDRYTLLMEKCDHAVTTPKLHMLWPFTIRISLRGTGASICLMRWRSNIHMPRKISAGIGCFPSPRLSTDPRSGVRQRHHLQPNALQKAVKRAIHDAGIRKTCLMSYVPPFVCKHIF